MAMPTKQLAGSIRRSAVAGYFYPADPRALEAQVKEQVFGQGTFFARGVILPHGPYQRCAKVIGAVLSKIRIPRTCVILGASHTDTLMRWSILLSGAYQTPLGEVPVNEAATAFLKEKCSFLEPDALGQRGEHAIEVLLPFLQLLGPEQLNVVPIIVNTGSDKELESLAEALKAFIQQANEPVLLVASSDLSHYEPHQQLVQRDHRLLEAIERLDENDLAGCIEAFGTRMCGYEAVACLLKAVKLLKASKTRLVDYETSSHFGKDPDSAIGYAGLIIE